MKYRHIKTGEVVEVKVVGDWWPEKYQLQRTGHYVQPEYFHANYEPLEEGGTDE